MNSDWFSVVISELLVAAALIFCFILVVRKKFFEKPRKTLNPAREFILFYRRNGAIIVKPSG
jgi:hypothetical protein